LAELIAVTKALQLSEGKTANIYIDAKYDFLVLHAHAVLWKERGLLTKESPTKYSKETLNVLKIVFLPKKIAVIHCSTYQRSEDQVAKGKQRADTAGKKAAGRPYVHLPNIHSLQRQGIT
jgi:hypothetical protein